MLPKGLGGQETTLELQGDGQTPVRGGEVGVGLLEHRNSSSFLELKNKNLPVCYLD